MENHAKRGSNSCATYRSSRFRSLTFRLTSAINYNRAATSSKSKSCADRLWPAVTALYHQMEVDVAESKTSRPRMELTLSHSCETSGPAGW
jgi:predicted porin